jgi:hypothetical protein
VQAKGRDGKLQPSTIEEIAMSATATSATTPHPFQLSALAQQAVAAPVPVSPAVEQEIDVVESIASRHPSAAHHGVLMFLLAFIAFTA